MTDAKVVALVPAARLAELEIAREIDQDVAQTLDYMKRMMTTAETEKSVCVGVVLVNREGSVTVGFGGGDIKGFTLLGGLDYLRHKVRTEVIDPHPERVDG